MHIEAMREADREADGEIDWRELEEISADRELAERCQERFMELMAMQLFFGESGSPWNCKEANKYVS